MNSVSQSIPSVYGSPGASVCPCSRNTQNDGLRTQLFTAGPLKVSINPNSRMVETLDENGVKVFETQISCWSSADKTVHDIMSCRNFPAKDREECSEQNKVAVANEVLRAAAPDMFNILSNLAPGDFSEECSDDQVVHHLTVGDVRRIRAVLARATDLSEFLSEDH